MKHFATPGFWRCYRHLPESLQRLADEKFALLKQDPNHPSLRLKKVSVFGSVRIHLRYRALAKERVEGLVWFWIGNHRDYEQLLRTKGGTL